MNSTYQQRKFVRILREKVDDMAENVYSSNEDDFYHQYREFISGIDKFAEATQLKGNFWEFEPEITKLVAGAYFLFDEFKKRNVYIPFKPTLKSSLN
ncbi:hypothetical protein J4477_04720 [Candidatus Pacearchaeota archaeon]|nr:hypothetical protein [Candidatus Pacearchaeota archaeon]